MSIKLYFQIIFTSIVIVALVSDLNAQNDSLSAITDSIAVQIDSTIVKTDTTVKPSLATKIFDVKLDSLSVNYFQGSIHNQKLERYQYIDTNTYYFQQYDPLKNKNGLYSTLSNIGLAHTNLVFSPTLSVDYYFSNQSFPKYIYENQQVKYYKLYIPYTEASYVIGPKKEQNFQIIFSRELIKRLTIGIDFALNNSPGSYANSKADDKRVFFTGQYYTKNARYGVIANYLYNKLIVEENGGIRYDSIFEDNLEKDRSEIPVNLSNAQNLVKQSGFFVEQYFNLLKPRPDTNKRKVDAGSISLSVHFQRNQMIYQDTDTVSYFYQPFDPPLNDDNTYDSIYQMRLRSKFQWSSIGYHDDPLSKVFNIFFGLSYEYIYQSFPNYEDNNSFIYNSLASLTYNQLKPYGGIGLNIKKSFRLDGYAELVIGGYNSGDLRINGTIDQYFGNIDRNFGKIHAGVEFVNRSPSWYFQNYQSNIYRWNNNFKKETNLLIFGEYQYKKLKAGFKFTTLGNHSYFNDSIRPEQLAEAATVLQAYVEGIAMIKKFGINTRLMYQQTSHPEVISLPDFAGVVDIFFRSPIFKRAATVQTGFQINYFTSFYAKAYMPALRDWHTQQTERIGNNIYADVYLTLMVKAARLFVKYAHFNSSFTGYNYYIAPGYPARDAGFYFGINWRFHN